MTRQVTDQLYIDLEYYQPEEYLVYVAEAEVLSGLYIDSGYIDEGYYEGQQIEASLTCDLTLVVGEVKEFESALFSEFTSVQTVEKIVGFAANFTSQFTIPLAMLSDISGVDMFAFAEASIAIAVDRIRDNNSQLSSDFDLATDFVKIIESDAVVLAEFTQTTTAERSRDIELNATVAFSFEVIETRVRDYVSEQTAEFDVFAVFSNVRGVDIVAPNFASLDCSAEKTAEVFGSITSTTSLTSLSGRLKSATSTLTAVTRLLASVPRFRYEFRSAAGEFFNSGVTGPIATTGDVIDNNDFIFGGGSLFIPATATSGTARQRGIRSINLPSNHLVLPNGPSFNDSNKSWQISFWFKRTGFPSNQQLIIFAGIPQSGFSSGSEAGWGFDTNLNFYTRYIGGGGTLVTDTWTPNLTGINLSNWNHVRLVKHISPATSNQFRVFFYFNGNLSRSFDTQSANDVIPSLSQLNFRSFLGGDYRVDDFRIRIGSGSQTPTTLPTEELPYISSTNFFELSRVRVQLKFNETRNDEEGIFVTQIAQASLTATTSLASAISGPVNASASLTSQSNLVAAVSVDRGADLVAFSEASLAADVERIQQGEIAAEVETALIAEVNLVVSGEVILQAESQQVTDAAKITENIIATESIATKLAIVAKIGDVIVDMQNISASDVTAEKITDVEGAFSSEFATDVDGDKFVGFDTALTAEASLAAVIGQLVEQLVQLESNAALSAESQVTYQAQAELDSEFIAVVDASGGTIRANADFVSEFNTVADIEIIRDNSVVAASEFNTAIDVVKTTDIAEELASKFTQTSTEDRIRSFEIATDAVAVKIVVAVKNITQDIEGSAEFTLSADSVKITNDQFVLTAEATTEVNAVYTADAATNAAAEFTFAGEGTTNITGDIHANSEFTLEADGDVTATIVLTAFAEAAVAVEVSVTRDFDSNINSEFTQEVDSNRIRHVDSNVSSEFNVDIIVQKIVDSGELQFDSIATSLSVGRKLVVDMKVYIIPQETRQYIIAEETRQYSIGQETRIHSIRSTR